MKRKRIISWLVKLGLSIFILIIINILSFLLNPNSSYWTEIQEFQFHYVMFDFIVSLILCLGIIEFSVLIAFLLEKVLPWTKAPALRFATQTLAIILFVALMFILQSQVYNLVSDDSALSKQDYLDILQYFIVTIVVSLLVTAIHTGFFLLNRWKTSISEAAELKIKTLELKEIAMQAELQSLKFQLDPHFMFNNFSTLSELINEDPITANTFLENLSRVYRYMIQNLKKDMISLDEEIRFVNYYVYLIKIRYDENVMIIIDIDAESKKLYIPPISIQLLIENAIKHNSATSSQPLTIKITARGNSLCVENNLQRIPHPFPSTGIGLKNIADRYKLLAIDAVPKVEEKDGQFIVTLALMNLK